VGPNATNIIQGENGSSSEIKVSRQILLVGGYTYLWSYSNGYTYYSLQFAVPPLPTAPLTGRIIYIETGLEDFAATGNLEVSLEYSDGLPGYWTLSSLATTTSGASYRSTPYAVSSGTITVIIVFSGSVWYVEGFVNSVLKVSVSVPSSAMPVALQAAYFGIQAYDLSTCSDIPSPLHATNVVLKVPPATPVCPSWIPDYSTPPFCSASASGTCTDAYIYW